MLRKARRSAKRHRDFRHYNQWWTPNARSELGNPNLPFIYRHPEYKRLFTHAMSSRSPIPSFKTMFSSRRQSVTPERRIARGPLERLPSQVIVEIGKRFPLRDVLQLSLCVRLFVLPFTLG